MNNERTFNMKKLLLSSVIYLWLCCGLAHAGSIIPMFTYQTGVSSITTAIISVTTSVPTGATQMDNPQLANRVAVEIQNIDSTANLWCLPVTTTPFINGGRKIASGNSWIVSAMDNFYQIIYSSTTGSSPNTFNVKFWCLSDGAAATKAAVTQVY